MLNHKYIIFYVLLLLYDKIQGENKVCPQYCSCDIYFDLHRATCQNKQLISVEIGMSPAAEILDLSHNQISQLGKNIFLVSYYKFTCFLPRRSIFKSIQCLRNLVQYYYVLINNT